MSDAAAGITDILGLGQVGSEVVKTAAYFLDKLIGPALAEAGLGIAAPLIAWKQRRVERALATITEAAERVTATGGDVQPVPGRILWPVLEQSSLEEDPDLRGMWAKLLATAAHPQTAETVLPSFPHILGELSPTEARMLEFISQHGVEASGYVSFSVANVSGHFDISHSETFIHRDNLQRLNLIALSPGVLVSRDEPKGSPYTGDLYLTSLGYSFIRACAS